MNLKVFCWFVLFLYVIVSAQAQTDQYKFSQVNVNKGLSHNQIKCFLRDSKGFMWFGTISGLNRYDGYSIKTFRNIPGDPTSISNSDINVLLSKLIIE
jgi:ligand-binding sensor domain-containing protein